MKRWRWLAVWSAVLLPAAGAALPAQNGSGPMRVGYEWILPGDFPRPPVPADNPVTPAKAELGRHLFYDTRLSGNGTQSCASCHQQTRAFTDGLPRSIGSTGEVHPRGSMSLVNIAYAAVLNWADATMTRLEDQALVPMFGEHPVELGLDRSGRWLEPLRSDATYQRLFRKAFPEAAEPFTQDHVVRAIAAFERTIVSARSPYDRYYFDRDENAISEAAKRGEVLFNSRQLSCFTCHGGVFFTHSMGARPRAMSVSFHNTGLYNLAGRLSYPPDNTGLYEVTGELSDVGRFKAPTLRNIAVTAPYMHDGSVATLEEAIDHYAAGGRTISSGPYQGVGRNNPNKSIGIQGFSITPEQRADLVAFLESLTDRELLEDPRFADPWPLVRKGGARRGDPMEAR